MKHNLTKDGLIRGNECEWQWFLASRHDLTNHLAVAIFPAGCQRSTARFVRRYEPRQRAATSTASCPARGTLTLRSRQRLWDSIRCSFITSSNPTTATCSIGGRQQEHASFIPGHVSAACFSPWRLLEPIARHERSKSCTTVGHWCICLRLCQFKSCRSKSS